MRSPHFARTSPGIASPRSELPCRRRRDCDRTRLASELLPKIIAMPSGAPRSALALAMVAITIAVVGCGEEPVKPER